MNSLRILSATTLTKPSNVVAAEWQLPTSLEWFPAGAHTINATVGEDAWTGLVVSESKDADRLDRQLQMLLSEARTGSRSRPFIDFDHQGGQAAAIPLRFFWNNGIRLEVEWTKAGREALEGRTYSYFSPEFILGDDDHPEALPVPGSIGSLVNTPAFQRIERLAAKHTDGMSDLLKAATAAGLVPDGVTDEGKAATHFAENIKAANRAKDENASLKAKLGEYERREKEAEDKRKEEAETEVDVWIKAGAVLPDSRELVIGMLIQNPAATRAQFGQARKVVAAGRSESPVSAATGVMIITEEEDRIRGEKDVRKRRELRAAWYDREIGKHLKAANTIGAGLVIGRLAEDAAIAVLQGKLAPLQAFGNVLSTTPMKPKTPVVVNVADFPVSSVLTNTANFEQSTITYTPKTVTPAQFTAPWNLANADIQNGIQIMDAAESAANALGQKVQDVITGLWVAANYANTAITTAAADWATDGPKAAFGAMVNASRHHLILTRALYAQIAYINKQSFVLTGAEQGAPAYMFDGIWFVDHIESAAATAGTEGLAFDPRAMVVAAGPPVTHPFASGYLATSNITIADMGLAVQSNAWFAPASRSPFISYDIVFGAIPGNAAVGWLINPT